MMLSLNSTISFVIYLDDAPSANLDDTVNKIKMTPRGEFHLIRQTNVPRTTYTLCTQSILKRMQEAAVAFPLSIMNPVGGVLGLAWSWRSYVLWTESGPRSSEERERPEKGRKCLPMLL